MTQHSPIALAGASAPSVKLPATRSDGWTPERQAAFLRHLSETHCVAKAARAVGMSRQSAYALRARLKGEPFDKAWAAALVCRLDALAEAAMDRALNGVEVPHYYKGELIGTSRRYDERLTLALIAMRAGQSQRDADLYATDPQARYASDEFGALLERVAEGPQTWEEEREAEAAQLHAVACAEAEAAGEDDPHTDLYEA